MYNQAYSYSLNPVELNYYPLMSSRDKYNGNSNAVKVLSTKICILSRAKDVNVKVFNMITRINEAKTLVKCISCDCKCKVNSTTYNSNQKWNNNKFPCECKSYHT